jgi:hypothetical protein
MSEPSANEQYLLELVNVSRAQAGAQPLAFDFQLNAAAERHSQWMIASDTFSHTGEGGSTATQRMTGAGYQLTGSWATAENIGWASTRAPDGLQDEVALLHTNLMNSPGHRTNLLNPAYREVGLGFEVGEFQGWNGAFVTENFARTGSAFFITGVAYRDLDADRAYDPGEGLGGLSVVARSSTGAVYSGQTYGSGGYDLAVPTGAYTVTFSGSGITTTTQQVNVGSANVKVDFLPAAQAPTTPPPTTPPPTTPQPAGQTLSGTSGGDTLAGAAGADTIRGLGGPDRLLGGEGQDRLEGAGGADVLNGGAGADTLVGGSGSDQFVFDAPLGTGVDRISDFNVYGDTIHLGAGVFTALGRGVLGADAFWTGPAAHDATDRVIYNRSTGELLYDPDGTGSAAAQPFAQLATGLSLTSADFLVV